jgi:hypothetical protein
VNRDPKVDVRTGMDTRALAGGWTPFGDEGAGLCDDGACILPTAESAAKLRRMPEAI